jgi:hypothetical protein
MAVMMCKEKKEKTKNSKDVILTNPCETKTTDSSGPCTSMDEFINQEHKKYAIADIFSWNPSSVLAPFT